MLCVKAQPTVPGRHAITGGAVACKGTGTNFGIRLNGHFVKEKSVHLHFPAFVTYSYRQGFEKCFRFVEVFVLT